MLYNIAVPTNNSLSESKLSKTASRTQLSRYIRRIYFLILINSDVKNVKFLNNLIEKKKDDSVY